MLLPGDPLLAPALAPGAPSGWVWALGALLFTALVIGAYTDLFVGRLIPNWIGWVGIGGLFVAGPALFEDWTLHVIVAVCIGVFCLVFALRGAVGVGDIKIYVILGLALGPLGAWIVVAAQVLALAIAGTIMLVRRHRFPIPMIPFVLMAFVVGTAPYLLSTVIAVMLGVSVLALITGLLMRGREAPRATLSALIDSLAPADGTSLVVTPYEAHLTLSDGTRSRIKAPGPMRLAAAVSRSFSHEEIVELDDSGVMRTTVNAGQRVFDVTVWAVKADYLVDARLAS